MLRIDPYCASCFVSLIVKRYNDGWTNNHVFFTEATAVTRKNTFFVEYEEQPFFRLKQP